jgi:pectin methylesterase-like acyl-CoA thioesterase
MASPVSVTLKTVDGAFSGFSKDGDWTFTTKAAPPPADTERVVVAADGHGDFNTVQGAIDFAPVSPSRRLTIFIKNGNYEELVFLNGKINLTIRGDDRAGVQVCYPNNSAFNPSRGGAFATPGVLDLQCDRHSAEHLHHQQLFHRPGGSAAGAR